VFLGHSVFFGTSCEVQLGNRLGNSGEFPNFGFMDRSMESEEGRQKNFKKVEVTATATPIRRNINSGRIEGEKRD
jgi:hypothetical protein